MNMKLTFATFISLVRWNEDVETVKVLALKYPDFATRMSLRITPEQWEKKVLAQSRVKNFLVKYENINVAAECGCPDEICEEKADQALDNLVAELKSIGMTIADVCSTRNPYEE